MAGEMMGANGPRLADAFGLTADPSAYVPRLALEAALAELGEVIGKTPACAALTGEAGLGKTLLLHVLRERLRGALECLYVPFPRLAAPELWRWVAVALGLGSGEDDRGAVLGRARRLHAEGSGLVLLVDDAGALPPSTRSDLLRATDTPGLSLVLAFNSEDHPQLGALPAHVRRVELGPPMTLTETRAYLHARLRRADPAGALAARLTPRQLASLQEASGGVPARLHALLDAWLRSTAAEPVVVAEPEPEEEEAPPARRAAAPTTKPAALPILPEGVAVWMRRLRSPRVRMALLAVFMLATLGAWLFALKRNSGVSSVGVPVERLESPRAEPAPPASAPPALEAAPAEGAEPAPAEAGALPEAVPVPAEAALAADPVPAEAEADAETGPISAAPPPPAHAAQAARTPARALAPPLPPAPPLPDPSRPEPTVHVSSPRFPDEHVPPLLEPRPLTPPPAGPRLSVNAQPWAEISLDGKPVGETPLGELQVSPGAHTLSAKLPDGRVVERSVEARTGDLYVVFP